MKITIGYLSKEDVPKIIEIEQASFTVPWEKDVFLGKIDSTLTAKIGNRIVSYILFEKIVDEIHIIRIATHPEFRRQGIARDLVVSVLREAVDSGIMSAYLEVRESNVASIKLYGSLGFVNISRRKSYYKDPDEDALVLAKKV